MLKSELAAELRQRQYDAGLVERKYIDVLNDDMIILSYITCSECGDVQLSEEELPLAIAQAKTVEEFFKICDRITPLVN